MAVAGVSFEHMRMGDRLREVHQYPNAEIGACSTGDEVEEGGRDRPLCRTAQRIARRL